MNKRFICTILCILSLLYIVSPIKADDAIIDNSGGTTTEVGDNSFLTVPQLDKYDFSISRPVPAAGGTVLPSMEGDKYTATYEMKIPVTTDENGKVVEPSLTDFKFGKDALTDPKDSNNYKGDAFKKSDSVKNTLGLKHAEIVKRNGEYYLVAKFEGDKTAFDNQSLLANAAQNLQDNIDNKGMLPAKALKEAIKSLGIQPENKKWYDAAVAKLKELANDPKALAEYIKEQLEYFKTKIAIKFDPPPLKVVNNPPAPGQGACEQWNKVPQPGPVTCLGADPKQGKRAECKVSKTEEFMSSYTTTTPNNSDPWIRNEQPFCEDQREGYMAFSEIMNPFGHRTWSKNDLVRNGLNQFLRKRNTSTFANNPWKSSWRGEPRSWNPFGKDNKLSGIPYQIEWSPLLDSWTDQVHNINPIITKSIEERDKAEKRNLDFARSYGFNNPLKVYNEAPNPTMRVTALNLDTNTWDVADTTNIYCVGQYEMKIEPRYDIQKWDRYRLFDHHKTEDESWTYSCECVQTRKYTCCVRDNYEWDWREQEWTGSCLEYGTCEECVKERHVKDDLGGVNTKYPKGMTTKGPSPAGSIPPVYKQRRKYQYRTGGMIEYHSITANPGNPRFRPIPNAYSDPTKIKAGYGFGYTTGMKVITD